MVHICRPTFGLCLVVGLATDENDHLWMGLAGRAGDGGGRVVEYNPATNAIVSSIGRHNLAKPHLSLLLILLFYIFEVKNSKEVQK